VKTTTKITKIIRDTEIPRSWKIVDANDKTLGRLATKIALLLMGKGKPNYSPHQDWGDFVIVINAEKVKITGNKANVKTYFKHTGYVGHEQLVPYKKILETKPEDIIRHAVRGMVKVQGPLGRRVYKKLFVYAGTDHPHAAQKPEAVKF